MQQPWRSLMGLSDIVYIMKGVHVYAKTYPIYTHLLQGRIFPQLCWVFV